MSDKSYSHFKAIKQAELLWQYLRSPTQLVDVHYRLVDVYYLDSRRLVTDSGRLLT